MATISVELPSPLAEFVLWHAVHCVPECCGPDAFDFEHGGVLGEEHDLDIAWIQLEDLRELWVSNADYYVKTINWCMTPSELQELFDMLEARISYFHGRRAQGS